MKILLPVIDLNMTYKTHKTSKNTWNSDFQKNVRFRFSRGISPVLVRYTPPSLVMPPPIQLLDVTLFLLSVGAISMLSPPPLSKLEQLDDSSAARAVGNTPLLLVKSLSSLLTSPTKRVQIYVKDEGSNPSGSSKDRIALSILRGKLASGCTSVAEGTSGSTGVALATLCAAIDLPCQIFMPSDQSSAKSLAIRERGAVCTVVPPSSISNPNNYVNLARRLPGFCDQFDNLDNYAAHFTTTGPEILQAGVAPDAFVMSAGTGGTIAGAGNFLKGSCGCDVVLADCEGSVLHSLATTGVAYTKEQGERVLRRNREDTICEGIGLDRVTRNFEKASIDRSYKVRKSGEMSLAHLIVYAVSPARSRRCWIRRWCTCQGTFSSTRAGLAGRQLLAIS